MADSFIFFLNCFVTLFSVLDPFGAAVTLIALTPDEAVEKRAAQAIRASRAMVAILLVFAVAGGAIFALFGISIQALKVAGGVILIQLSLRMLEGKSLTYRTMKSERDEAGDKEDIAIIPMAIPLLAGPAAIATVIVFADRAQGAVGWFMLILAILCATGLTALILREGQKMADWVGETGLRILIRVLGLILLAMGAEFVLSAVKGYFG
ncbi:MAG TPA: NAAT family transporter [Nitrospirae bacterium]|nr:NAAT family transporter [Nitrospirota bacterium]